MSFARMTTSLKKSLNEPFPNSAFSHYLGQMETKKADVVEHLGAFDRVGLLCNELLPDRGELHFV